MLYIFTLVTPHHLEAGQRGLLLRSRNFHQLAFGYQTAMYNPKMGAKKENNVLGCILKASPV